MEGRTSFLPGRAPLVLVKVINACDLNCCQQRNALIQIGSQDLPSGSIP